MASADCTARLITDKEGMIYKANQRGGGALKYSALEPIEGLSQDNGGWRPIKANRENRRMPGSKSATRQGCRAQTPRKG